MRFKLPLITLIFTSLILFALAVNAQQDSAINDPGDIAFIGWSSSNQDGYAFVFTDDCPNGTTIKFIDEEWTGSSFYSSTGEGENTWTNSTGSYVQKGSVIVIQNADNNPTVNIGSVSESDAGFNIASTSADQIFAIVGSRASPTFIAMIGHTTLPNNGTGNVQTMGGTGLSIGTHAIHRTKESLYQGSNSCGSNLSSCLQMIYSDSNWTDLSTTVTYPNSLITSFGGTVLPVTLASFSATLQGNSVVLDWTTSLELNNDGFKVQWSDNGYDWQEIGFVTGQGNSYTLNSYSYQDSIHCCTLNSFYRLAQVDFDGTKTLSHIRYVKAKEPFIKTNMCWHNTSYGIKIIAPDNILSIDLYDLQGRHLHQTTPNELTAKIERELTGNGRFIAVIRFENHLDMVQIEMRMPY
ncbi:MAG: hypothetical protein ACI9JN_002925 [Bacteroidia bacterium]|jgi:hypothetical protein